MKYAINIHNVEKETNIFFRVVKVKFDSFEINPSFIFHIDSNMFSS